MNLLLGFVLAFATAVTPLAAIAKPCAFPAVGLLLPGNYGVFSDPEDVIGLGLAHYVPHGASANATGGGITILQMISAPMWHRRYHTELVEFAHESGDVPLATADKLWGHGALIQFRQPGATNSAWWIASGSVVAKGFGPGVLMNGPTLCSIP